MLIIVHEFGHFIAAKATGMRVERFFLFFPPKIVSIKRGETEYGIGTLPFGGFVKITGMNPDEVEPDRGRGGRQSRQGVMTKVEGAGRGVARAAATGRRGARLLPPARVEADRRDRAGPAMNLLLAFVILFAISLSLNQVDASVGTSIRATRPRSSSSPATRSSPWTARASRMLSQEERHNALLTPRHASTSAPSSLRRTAARRTPVELTINRDGQVEHLPITPIYDEQDKRMRLGFSYGTTSVDQSVPEAAGSAASEMWRVTTGTVGVFAKIFQPQERKKIHGIVGISDVTQQAFEFGAVAALSLVALISLSLAIINLFPFLPLDGGHIFWSVVEKIRGRPVSFSVMERASAVGFLLVMILFAIGLTNDITALNNGGLNIR